MNSYRYEIECKDVRGANVTSDLYVIDCHLVNGDKILTLPEVYYSFGSALMAKNYLSEFASNSIAIRENKQSIREFMAWFRSEEYKQAYT